MKQKHIIRKVLATLVVLAVVASGTVFAARQAVPDEAAAGKLRVVASYYPLYEFTKQVGKEKVAVANITPAGAEPHEYEPSAKALANAGQAAVFVYNGAHMEPWVDGFLDGYHGQVVQASKGLPLLEAVDENRPDVAVQDPHFWLDPVLAAQMVDTIAQSLGKADPANKAYYVANAAAYRAQLGQLHADFTKGLAQCKLHQVIASHDAFAYLGKRYGLTVTPIAGLTPEAEPDPARLAQLSDIVKNGGIRYVFFEQLASRQLADTIAKETGAQTLVFDPIEGINDADQKQGKDYLSAQRENLANLRTALACK